MINRSFPLLDGVGLGLFIGFTTFMVSAIWQSEFGAKVGVTVFIVSLIALVFLGVLRA